MSAELLRRLNNIVCIGSVSESKSEEGRSLVRVKILQRVTDFLPVLQNASSFKREACPLKVNEQVVVLHPYGDGNSGVVLGSLFHKDAKEPQGYTQDKEITEYVDGTRLSYDVGSSTLEVHCVGNVKIFCDSAEVEAQTLNVKAQTVHDGELTINGNLIVDGDITSSGTVEGSSIKNSTVTLGGHTHMTSHGSSGVAQ